MVLIIIGWGDESIKDYGAVRRKKCSNCKTEQHLHLVKKSEWFSVFYINIFPYDVIYYLACTSCSTGDRITKIEFDEFLNSKES